MAFFMSDYYSIPTTLGAARLAAAANNGQALTLSHMAFGDANGVPYLPNSRVNAAALVNERYRIAVQYVVQDAQNPNVFIIKARIPASIGGFDVCEIGIFDTNGELIYLANYPRTSKPQITQGAGGELTIRIHVMTSHSSSISIILDPHVITLTQAEGDNRYALKTQLDDEAATRANIDNILGDAINNEAAIRLTQDLALSIAIAAEITNRENALINYALKTELPIQATTSMFGIARLADQSDVTFGQNDNTIVTPTQLKNGYAVNGSMNGYMRLPSFLSNLTIQWGKYTGSESNGQISFHTPFSLGVVHINVCPIFDSNITDANAPSTHIKSYDSNGFNFASGLEYEFDDVFHAHPHNFFWFALGF